MPAPSDVFVSVVATLADDADILPAFLAEVSAELRQHYANYEVVLVDDASRDATAELVPQMLAEFPCVRYYQLSQRHGVEIAVSCGLDAVIGDVVVVMDPATDPPALISELVRRVRAGRSVVYGTVSHRTGEPPLRRFAAACYYWVAVKLFGLPLMPEATLFRALSRQAVNTVALIRDRARFIRLLTASVGLRSEALPYERLRRRARPRVRSLRESASLGIALLIANSRHPLRIMALVALAAAAANFAYIGYILLVYVLKSDVAEGWSTLSLQLSGSFGIAFVILAVLCEYVGQIQEQSRDRPLYVVQDDRTSVVMVANEARRNVAKASLVAGDAP